MIQIGVQKYLHACIDYIDYIHTSYMQKIIIQRARGPGDAEDRKSHGPKDTKRLYCDNSNQVSAHLEKRPAEPKVVACLTINTRC